MLDKATKFSLRNKNVLLRRNDVEDKIFSGGLILAPENRIDKNLKCTVIATHPGVKFGDKVVPSEVKPGDVVALRQWSGRAVDELEDPNVLIVQEELIEWIYGLEEPCPKAVALIKQLEGLNG